MSLRNTFFGFFLRKKKPKSDTVRNSNFNVTRMTGVRMIGELIRTEGRRSEDINVT